METCRGLPSGDRRGGPPMSASLLTVQGSSDRKRSRGTAAKASTRPGVRRLVTACSSSAKNRRSASSIATLAFLPPRRRWLTRQDLLRDERVDFGPIRGDQHARCLHPLIRRLAPRLRDETHFA